MSLTEKGLEMSKRRDGPIEGKISLHSLCVVTNPEETHGEVGFREDYIIFWNLVAFSPTVDKNPGLIRRVTTHALLTAPRYEPPAGVFLRAREKEVLLLRC